MTNTDNNKRIAKNTIFLYFRMFLIMGVSLYTSRIVLNTLGVVDFGIYNVVGGVVIMFSFLNGAMAQTTQRFLSFEIGKKDYLQLKKVFSISLSIHLLISVLLVLLAETIGLWFFNTRMNIPTDRMDAALWVYHFSVFTFVISVIQVPYNASIIANEKMDVYAYVSIVEVLLRLLIIYILVWYGFDKLKLYAVLTCGVSVIVTIIYQSYCKRKFKECHYHFYKDKSLFYSLLQFSGWSLFGNLAWVMMGQGFNILLNIFFGPVVNAATGIAFQVNTAVLTFVNNFRIAVNPQIVKSYATGNKEYMNTLVFESTKYSFYLIFLLSLPILLETNSILRVWLKIVPQHTIIFCQLILINTLIQCFDMGIIFKAIGKIKANQLIGGVTYLLIIPITYILFKSGYFPVTVFYVQIVATIFVNFGINIYLLNKIASINPLFYISKVLLPIIKVSVVASAFPCLIKFIVPEGVEQFFCVITISILSVILSVYFIEMSKSTRLKVKSVIVSKFNIIKVSH